MKKMRRYSILLAIIAMMALVSASFFPTVRTVAAATASSAELFTEADMRQALAEFIGDGMAENSRADRTSFRDGERAAAAWLESKLLSLGYKPESGYEDAENPLLRPFTYLEEYKSQNVTAVYPSAEENAPQILLTANYDNNYGDIGNLSGVGGAGALQNGTGVAVLLAIAEALINQSPELPFSVRFVFFGASEVGLIGSGFFLSDQLSAAEREKIALVVGVRRIGVDYSYLYTDEVDTAHGDMFLETSQSGGYGVVAQPRSVPYIPAEYKEGLPYATWGMLGDQVRFMSRDMNIVSIYGGNLETMNVADIDGKAGTITYTSNDTLEGLQKYYPDYGKKMAEVAGLIYDTISKDDFIQVCLNSAQSRYDYTWLTKPAAVTGITLGILIVCGIVLVVLVRYFQKKYPLKPLVRKLKIAVFGMEYERPDEENIFVDVKTNGVPPNPFE